MPPMNAYVLAALLAFAGCYALVQEVKAPVKAAVHRIVHVVTLGKK